MGNRVSSLSTVAPEPVTAEITLSQGVCFICLNSCEQVYETACSCILYCHTSCSRQYEPHRRFNCPVCRRHRRLRRERGGRIVEIDEESRNELNNNMNVTLFQRLASFSFLLIISFLVPLLIGIIFAIITYFTYPVKINFLNYFSNNFLGYWVIGLLFTVSFITVIWIFNTCIKCLT